MTFDAQQFKSQFPLFKQQDNHSLVYLDNAATTQKPQCVLDAIMNFYITQNGNAQRASHRLARNATMLIEQVRQQAAEFLGANSVAEVIFTSGATQAINTIAYGLESLCEEGDEILLVHSEHHANLLPWQRLAQNIHGEIKFFPEEKGVPQYSRWQTVVNEKTRIIALSGASNVLGTVIDFSVLQLIKQHYPDVIIVLDASQLACHIPLQSNDWACDFLVFSAHKMYGPTGIGLLYGREKILNMMEPLLLGGEMVDKVERESSTFAEGYQRFEAGTSSLGAIAGLGACFTFWQQQDRTAMQEYEIALTQYLHQQLQIVCESYSGLNLLTDAIDNVGVAVLAVDSIGFDASDLAAWLDEHDIAVRAGDHCAQPLWDSLSETYQVDKGLRISLAAYNAREDVDCLIKSIQSFFANDFNEGSDSDNVSQLSLDELLQKKSWQQRYTLLLRWGSCISCKPDIRTDKNLVKGCESAVWLEHRQDEDKNYFLMDSDSRVIKGLSVLLLLWFDGKTTEEITQFDALAYCEELGLQKYLSPSRANGFMSLLDRMKSLTASL